MSEECKSAEATACAAVAQAEDKARHAAAKRSMADTSSTGAEPSSAVPPMEAGLTSADLVRCAEQMEVEIRWPIHPPRALSPRPQRRR